MNVALLGLGRWGKTWTGVLDRAGWNTVATADPAVSGATHADALSAINAPGVEAVLIATPPDTHYDLARIALAAGKHVLCEKPLAFSEAACRDLGTIAGAVNRTLMVNYLPLFLDEVQAAPIGSWCGAHSCVFLRYSTRSSAFGPLWDLAVHDLALAAHLFGALPASGWRRRDDEHGSSLETFLPLNGPLLTIAAGYGRRGRRAMTVWRDGSRSELTQDQTSPEPLAAVLREFRAVVAGERENQADAVLSAAIAAVLSAAEGVI